VYQEAEELGPGLEEEGGEEEEGEVGGCQGDQDGRGEVFYIGPTRRVQEL